ncbi:MAG TPA: hypothetical protein VGX52_13220, partial [Burkholderiales bacterium]|nr:hypothetical protein [Burkholderiales bacterium]
MTRIIALLLALACGPAAATDVALIGLMGDKAAVLAIGGGEPKTVRVGQKWGGVSVISVERGQATVEIDGKRRVLLIGLMGDKAAVLAIGGGEPKTVRVGQKWSGVTVISVERGQATV